jgi:hypothetical protein
MQPKLQPSISPKGTYLYLTGVTRLRRMSCSWAGGMELRVTEERYINQGTDPSALDGPSIGWPVSLRRFPAHRPELLALSLEQRKQSTALHVSHALREPLLIHQWRRCCDASFIQLGN